MRDQWYHADIYRDEGLVLRDVLRWSFAGITVLSIYAVCAVSLYNHGVEPERLAGSPPAIMLEFSEEPTAPNMQAFSETIRSGMQVDESEPQSQHVNPDEIRTAESDFAEKQRPKEKKTTKDTPEKKIKRKHWEKQRKKHQNHVSKGKQDQKAATPEIEARSGKTFTGRDNSRSEGFNGRSDKAWADRVHRRIQSIGQRMQRQLPGVRGVVYVSFVFDASGRISAVSIFRSSGDSRTDQLALRIVEHSSPLPFPPGAGKRTVPVRIN